MAIYKQGVEDPKYTDAEAIAAIEGNPETLAVLLKGINLLHIPTNTGWTESNAESGATEQKLSYNAVRTDVTPNSRGMLYATIWGFQSEGENLMAINYDKKLYLIFNYSRGVSAPHAVARLQLKEDDFIEEGALEIKGIGLRVDNLDLVGESYGTELGEVDLATTLTSDLQYRIVIIHYPASKIEWYVNGTLKGTQSTLAKIPSGMAELESAIVHSIVNNEDEFNAWSELMQPKLWQER